MDPRILCPPQIQHNIPEEPAGVILYEAISSHPQDNVAILDLKSGESYTYKQLITYSYNLGTALRNLGIGKNSIISIVATNSHKYMVALFASIFIAAPVHLINPNYTEYELRNILKLSKPKLIFCNGESVPKLLRIKQDFDWIKYLIIFNEPSSHLNYDDLIKTSSDDFRIETDIDICKQVAVILNSSGTTGLPKGVMLSHKNFVLDFIHARNPETTAVFTSKSVGLIVAPLFHMYGSCITKLCIFLSAKVILMENFQPETYLKAIEDYKVTHLFIVPSLTIFFATSPMVKQYDVSSVQEIFSAGSSPNEDILQKLKERFTIKHVRQFYSLTELTAGTCITPPYNTKPGSCGKLYPGRQMKIVDQNTGTLQGPNQCGEIRIKNDIMLGYINDALRTEEILDEDGFLCTGDLGYYDEDGFVYVIDRIKDLIKYKGFQVAPLELENIILNMKGIKEVAVIGKPDNKTGELPMAFVVKELSSQITEQDIIDYVAALLSVEKHLHGGVLFLEQLPRNNLGKVIKADLRKLISKQ